MNRKGLGPDIFELPISSVAVQFSNTIGRDITILNRHEFVEPVDTNAFEH